MFGDFKILSDVQNIGIKDIFDIYSGINQQKIARGALESETALERMRLQAELYNQQWMRDTTASAGGFVMDNRLLTFAVIAGLGFVAYKLIK